VNESLAGSPRRRRYCRIPHITGTRDRQAIPASACLSPQRSGLAERCFEVALRLRPTPPHRPGLPPLPVLPAPIC